MLQETPRLELLGIKEISEKSCVKVALKGKFSSHMDMQPLDIFYKKYRKKGFINFLFDFSEVSFLCSIGLSKFAQYIQDVEKEDGKIIICAPTQAVLHVIEVVNLHHKLNISNSHKEALEKL